MNKGEKKMVLPAIALHRHLEQAYLALAQAFQPEWHQEFGGTWFFTNHSVPVGNGVLRTECSASQIDHLVASVVRQAQDRQVPLLWLVGPATQPLNLAQRLEEWALT